MTEWTESRNWTESTEAREAKRSARRKLRFNEAGKARPRGCDHQDGLHGGLAASYVAASPIWPIVIWYGQRTDSVVLGLQKQAFMQPR